MSNQKDVFHMVFEFNSMIRTKTPFVESGRIEPVSGEAKQWLISALHEELNEFAEEPWVVDQIDALIDLMYFAIGGMYRMGLTSEEARKAFELVHIANMNKKAGIDPTKERVQGLTDVQDAIKPENWVDPKTEILKMLKRNLK